MTRHKRTEITIETERTLVIARRQSTRAWCRECGCDVYVIHAEMLTVTSRPRLVNSMGGAATGKWHSFAGPDGKVLVCLESLMKAM
jgi:hypothetical protein